ncbi:MAG TPA: DUF1801 domain-containing protein [Pseudolysinimonas sp.]|jgi:uncharacterized protein YdhG (YjbR/CyaY superfamily)
MNVDRGSAEAGPLSAYLGELDPQVTAALGAIVDRAGELVGGVEEGRTYGMPGLVYRGRPLLSVRATREHLGYYPFSEAVVESVAADLADFSLSKGTVRFSLEHPLPAAIVDRMILARRDEIDAALGPV